MKISINITDNQFSASMKEELWNIYKKYYNYNKDDFMKRLAKNNQFAIYKNKGNIVGFTGLRIDRTTIDGKSSLLIYFGQTVIEKECRGNALLPFTGLKLCLKYFKDLMFSDVYFWCDALTYKSYLVFAKSMNECYPSHKHQTPKSIKNLINHIGQKHYKGSFHSVLGTVQKSTVLVSDPSVNIGTNDKQDADIQFFMKANPNYKKGHGLLTLAPLTRKSFFLVLNRFVDKLFKNIGHSKANLAQNLMAYFAKLNNPVSASS